MTCLTDGKGSGSSIVKEFIQANRGSDPQIALGVRLHLFQRIDFADVHDAVWRDHHPLHQTDKIGASCQHCACFFLSVSNATASASVRGWAYSKFFMALSFRSSECIEDAFGGHRQRWHAGAGGIADGIGDCRGAANRRWFTQSDDTSRAFAFRFVKLNHQFTDITEAWQSIVVQLAVHENARLADR